MTYTPLFSVVDSRGQFKTSINDRKSPLTLSNDHNIQKNAKYHQKTDKTIIFRQQNEQLLQLKEQYLKLKAQYEKEKKEIHYKILSLERELRKEEKIAQEYEIELARYNNDDANNSNDNSNEVIFGCSNIVEKIWKIVNNYKNTTRSLESLGVSSDGRNKYHSEASDEHDNAAHDIQEEGVFTKTSSNPSPYIR